MIKNGRSKQQYQHPDVKLTQPCGTKAGADENREQAVGKCEVALAHRPLITTPAAECLTQHTSHFRQVRQDHCHDRRNRRHARNWCKWQVERCIGNNIGQFVEDCAQPRLLPMLARQHSINGVERHAREERDRQKQKPDRRTRKEVRHQAMSDAPATGKHRHLIGRDACGGEANAGGPQHCLKPRLETVNAGHK